MTKSSAKFFIVIVVILLFTQAIVYLSLNYEDVKDLLSSSKDSVENLDYKSIRLSKFAKQNNSIITVKRCSFVTKQEPSYKPAIFSEIFFPRFINNIYFDSFNLNNYYDNIC